jgi:putative selenium metabolism hydrolase
VFNIDEIQRASASVAGEGIEFLRELIRIPSPSGGEGNVVQAIAERMRAVGFDEVRIDGFGNVLGRIGHGRRTLAFDAHVDTVGVGDARLWQVDPFAAEYRDGVIYGRGASDQKGGMAALVYAGAAIKQLALEGDATFWMVGSVLEEDCDGLCWHYLLKEHVLEPDLVVLTEPTDLNVYRGHRGRMEIEVTSRGRSCHGSAPERGINAIYRMAPLISGIERLPTELGQDDFLGAGSVTISEVRSTAPSLCAVADSCTIHLDRRLTAGETDQIALNEIRRTAHALAQEVEITIPEFRRPSHTGLVYPMQQYFPAWTLPESHRFVQMALRARRSALGQAGPTGRWTFSTNGVATMGLHGVPTIGFGPANEIHAHAPSDQCPADHIGKAIAFYVTLTALFASEE